MCLELRRILFWVELEMLFTRDGKEQRSSKKCQQVFWGAKNKDKLSKKRFESATTRWMSKSFFPCSLLLLISYLSQEKCIIKSLWRLVVNFFHKMIAVKVLAEIPWNKKFSFQKLGFYVNLENVISGHDLYVDLFMWMKVG